jgi:triosephosphate isomerase
MTQQSAPDVIETDLSGIELINQPLLNKGTAFTEAERDAGSAEAAVCRQLDGSLPRSESAAAHLTVAYEPVWAIGTGRVPSLDDVGAMHRAIRARLGAIYGEAAASISILYGGSVNAGNAAELLRADEVGGALVGGASLAAESFLAIVLAAEG